MEAKLFKTALAEFIQADWTGKNESGWHPLGDKILIRPDHVSETTKGKVFITQDSQERMTMAAEAGLVIAVGDGAFMWNTDGTKFEGRKPKPGDRVSIGRYSGQLMMGQDGITYRVMDTSQVGAIAEGVSK